MIEIIPNLHPIFVHYTLALISISFLFYFLAYVFASVSPNYSNQFQITGRWCLWTGTIISLGTVMAGIYAFFTVSHDEAAFAAMKIHRNFALITATLVILVAIWSLVGYLLKKRQSLYFLVALFIVQIPLLITAYLGSEVVYRHGVGVMSLPQTPTHP